MPKFRITWRPEGKKKGEWEFVLREFANEQEAWEYAENEKYCPGSGHTVEEVEE